MCVLANGIMNQWPVSTGKRWNCTLLECIELVCTGTSEIGRFHREPAFLHLRGEYSGSSQLGYYLVAGLLASSEWKEW